MFGFIADAIETTVDVGFGLLEGELPTQKQVVTLIEAGMTAYAIAEVTGVAVDVIENMMED